MDEEGAHKDKYCRSFKTLAELTQHMQETQHYTKVISQEQITSWKNQAAAQGTFSTHNQQKGFHLSQTLSLQLSTIFPKAQ